ncbi:MAG: YlxR family protein [Actinobacteria bacterium]|nr:YlxR family protein [Actinomycetota bacterium]
MPPQRSRFTARPSGHRRCLPRKGTTNQPRESGHRPIRTCVGCGRKGPKEELFRFVAPHGVLALGDGHGGRSAYTCRRLACFERARFHNAFNRTLRRKVQVEAGLSQLFASP